MKWVIGLATTGLVVLVTFVAVGLTGGGDPRGSSAYPHSLLEADRVMTERMAVQTWMAEDGMLLRSADPTYVRALEEHSQQFDRMLARVP